MLPRRVPAGAVELRALTTEHAGPIVDAIAGSLEALRPWFPWAQAPPQIDEQVDRAHAAQRAFAAGTDFEFSLFEVSTNLLVGGLRVNPAAGPGIAEIGYWVRSDRHRRGYASSAVVAAADAVFEHLRAIDAVEIRMDVANSASAGVARSARFERTGEIERPLVAPGHTGLAFVWTRQRSATR